MLDDANERIIHLLFEFCVFFIEKMYLKLEKMVLEIELL